MLGSHAANSTLVDTQMALGVKKGRVGDEGQSVCVWFGEGDGKYLCMCTTVLYHE